MTLRSLFASLCALSMVCGAPSPRAGAQAFGAPRATSPDGALGGDIEPPFIDGNGRPPLVGNARPPGGPRRPDDPAAENGGAITIPPTTVQVDMGQIKRVRVGGELLNATPLRVGNVDVLAPAVNQFSKIGATVTQAAPENIPGGLNTPTETKYFQINLASGPPIVMAMNRAVAYVKGAEQPLAAAPILIDGKIWLPLYSIAPLIGAATRLEGDGTLNLNPTIQSVQLYPFRNTVALTVKASAPLPQGKVLMGTMEKPAKLYLDFPGFSMGFDATGSTDQRTVAQGLGNVTAVRAGLFQKFPDTTRLVLDLKTPSSGVAQPLPDATSFTLVLVPPTGRVSPPIPVPGMNSDLTPQPPTTDTKPIPGRPLSGWKIVIDAGHGGKDIGARGNGSYEKTHTLDIAARLSQRLRELGATPLMVRSTDNYVSLEGRVAFANQQNADLFVSVHINASKNHGAGGTETFYRTAQSVFLAREVHKELAKATGLKNNGTNGSRAFYVIRNTDMPSILTESAFISNSREEALLKTPAFRQKIAEGIARGLVNYVAKNRRR